MIKGATSGRMTLFPTALTSLETSGKYRHTGTDFLGFFLQEQAALITCPTPSSRNGTPQDAIITGNGSDKLRRAIDKRFDCHCTGVGRNYAQRCFRAVKRALSHRP